MKPFVLFLFLMFCHVRGQMQAGSNAEQGDFKYAVQIKYPILIREKRKKDCHCAGAIVHANWVVTAAHCTHQNGIIQEISIIAGDIWREKSNIPGESQNRREYNASEVIQHPAYDRSIEQSIYYFDIALLYFKDRIDFSSGDVDLIPLPQTPMEMIPATGDECTVMGWGHTWIVNEHDDALRIEGSASRRLKYADIIISGWTATKVFWRSSNAYSTKRIKVNFELEGTRGLQGDSGSPLVCKDSNHEEVLYGVFSGIVFTSHNEYESVTHHLAWIREKMEEQVRQDENEERYVLFVAGVAGMVVSWYIWNERR